MEGVGKVLVGYVLLAQQAARYLFFFNIIFVSLFLEFLEFFFFFSLRRKIAEKDRSRGTHRATFTTNQ